MDDSVFEVFARKTRAEPLHHIGYVNASDGELARVYAWTTYDEQNWFEMCVVPRAAILPVNHTDSLYSATDTARLEAIVRAVGTGSYGGSEVADGEAVR
jgi:1,2-phenylacetyl-CoA epoxidase PaaB subunit